MNEEIDLLKEENIKTTKSQDVKTVNKRIKSIDIAKAIGIILIVLGHISINDTVSHFIYSFHVPVFFAISGYLYKQYNKTFDFIKRKFKTILIPYFIFGLLSFLYWFVIERHFRENSINPLIPFINIFVAQAGEYNFIANSALWFLPCLFCTEIIFDFLKKITKNNRNLFICIVLISIIGCIYAEFNFVSLPFELNTAFIAIGFYFCGYFWKNKLEELFKSIIKNKKIKSLIILVSLTIVFILSEVNQGIDMYSENYNNYLLAYICAILGSFAIYLIADLIAKNKLLEFIGANTLIIMCIHEPIKRVVIEILHILTNISEEILRTNIIYIIIITTILMMMMFPIILFINKKTPFLIGKRK